MIAGKPILRSGYRGAGRTRRLVLMAAAILIGPLVTVLATAIPAAADACKPVAQGGQPSSVWIGGMHNEGIISSTNPGASISVPVSFSQVAIYLSGIVPSGTNIAFFFDYTDGHSEEHDSANADGNCVVHFDDSQDQLLAVHTGTGRVSATYRNWQTGQMVNRQPIGTLFQGTSGTSGTSTCPNGMPCGWYTVSGLGSRKRQVLANGGNSLDLAVGMLETDTMTANYPYGDNKTGDSANFGIFKQNWLMLRNACGNFLGETAGQFNDGSILNSDLFTDVNCLHQSQSHYGIDTWFAGHRNGATGLSNPNTPDIANYKAAVYWIQQQINSNPANLSNDIRFWVQVPAI